jgi:hypothetical protein
MHDQLQKGGTMKLRQVAIFTLVMGAILRFPLPAALAASGPLWVSSASTVAGNGTSCNSPGFNTIQAAIAAAPSGATVDVCAGTYVEQLTIEKALTIIGTGGSVTIQLPATPAHSITTCDMAIENAFGGQDQDGISICTNGPVNISGVVLDAAWPAGTCSDNLQGILVGGGAKLTLKKSSITAAGAVPLNGCQGGIGIQVGQSETTPLQVGHLFTNTVSVSGYQKNGITIDGAGSTATITKTTVTGIGATDQLAQNGIQVSGGAKASITRSVITGNECDDTAGGCGPDPVMNVQSTGLLFFGAAKGSTVSNSTITENDIGVYNFNTGTIAPSVSQLSVTRDKFVNNRYEGVVFDQGFATASNDSFSVGNVGIQSIQYNGQTFGSKGVANADTVSDMSVAAVRVSSDQAAGDILGSLSISNSKISGNPGPVLDNSSNFVVSQSNNF